MICDDTVWAVGGSVRDTLLGRPTNDLDYAVEGDAILFATSVAAPWGFRVATHPSFRTATVYTELYTLDFATCRNETYKKPGAMPSCYFKYVSIEEDLLRRDFTVNAIAKNTKTGQYVWHKDAQYDLHLKQLRVLHERSFIDDPTRMLRAIRYAVSHSFKIEKDTEDLFDPELLNTISKGRLERHVSFGLRNEHWGLLQKYGLESVIRGRLGWPVASS